MEWFWTVISSSHENPDFSCPQNTKAENSSVHNPEQTNTTAFSVIQNQKHTRHSCFVALLKPLIHQDVINVVTDALLLMQMDSAQCPKLSRKHIHLWVLEVSMSIIYVYGCHLITCTIKRWSDIATGGGGALQRKTLKKHLYANWYIFKKSF